MMSLIQNVLSVSSYSVSLTNNENVGSVQKSVNTGSVIESEGWALLLAKIARKHSTDQRISGAVLVLRLHIAREIEREHKRVFARLLGLCILVDERGFTDQFVLEIGPGLVKFSFQLGWVGVKEIFKRQFVQPGRCFHRPQNLATDVFRIRQ